MQEYIKTIWKALKADLKTRAIIAISFTIFLVCSNYVKSLPVGNKIFSIFAIPVFLICIIAWISLIWDWCKNLLKYIRRKRRYNSYVHYLFNLSERQYLIVQKMYLSPHYQLQLRFDDPDVRDLMRSEIIYVVADRFPWKDEINPLVTFRLANQALEVIDENYDKFIGLVK